MAGKLDILRGDQHAFDPKAARFLADGFGEYALRMKVGKQVGSESYGYDDGSVLAGGALQNDRVMGRRITLIRLGADARAYFDLSGTLPGVWEAWRLELVFGWRGSRHVLPLGPSGANTQRFIEFDSNPDVLTTRQDIANHVGEWVGVRARFAYAAKMSWALSQEAFELL